VAKIHSNLKAAFQLARAQQYAAAIGNHDRTNRTIKPCFKPGDLLYLWERSSKDSAVENSTSDKSNNFTKLPTKWTNPWSGPYPFLEWVSERACKIDYKGKPTPFPINRLTKHFPWESANPDTNKWCLQNRIEGMESAASKSSSTPIEDTPVPLPPEFILLPDSLIVFPMEIDEENLLPFGIGRVISHKRSHPIHFQWMGNFHQNQKAKFHPMWFQSSDKRTYYRPKPLRPSHPAYTDKDLGTLVKAEDVILYSVDKPFLNDGFLQPWALKRIQENEFIIQSIQDFEEKRKLLWIKTQNF
jgi:hypothetical protein